MSPESQLGNLNGEVEKADGETVETYEVAESAASMHRQSLEEIANLAEQDQFDILGVWKLDRLTRANPWESIAYLRRLKDANITLYAGTHGYFDWDELYDFQMIIRQVVFSREWYERIRQNSKEGIFRHLQNGKWPHGDLGFGYTKDKQKNIQLTARGEEIIPKVFDVYLELENRTTTRRRVNDAFEFTEQQELSDEVLKNILENRLCIGQLTYEGEVISEKPELAVVDRDVFSRAQEILKERRVTSTGVSHTPEWLDRVAERFGPEFTISEIDGFNLQCPRCNSDLRHHSSREIKRDKQVRTYKCKGDKCPEDECMEDECTENECKNNKCNFAGPLLSEDAIDKFHQALPLRCPFCPATEIFKVEEIDTGRWNYRYTCQACEISFGTNAKSDRLKRGLQYPDLKFDLNRKIRVEATKRNSENQETDSDNEDCQETCQKSLSSF